jgi:hemerythrin-like domain-containing protein
MSTSIATLVPSMSFQQQLTLQHSACDNAFAEIESQLESANWLGVERAFTQFLRDIEEHFDYEEQVLFPALEAASPMALQPVTVMRAEHEQIRELAADLRQAINEQQSDLTRGSLETLMFLIQQHNAKEENVLYPMADQLLSTALLADTPVTAENNR